MNHGLHATLLALCMVGVRTTPCLGQNPAIEQTEAESRLYVRSVARVFGTAPAEADLLAGWLSHPSELPVLLHLAARAGVSPDIVGSLRRSGASWQRLASKFGLSSAVFYVEVGETQVGGVLARPLRQFRDRPPARWHAIALTDMEIVALVNVRVLAEAASTSPSEVAVALDSPAPDFVAAYVGLLRSRAGAGPVEG